MYGNGRVNSIRQRTGGGGIWEKSLEVSVGDKGTTKGMVSASRAVRNDVGMLPNKIASVLLHYHWCGL